MAKESRAFGSQRYVKQHLLLGKGGVAGEVLDLRNDVEEGFQNFEGRASFPEIDWIDISAGKPSISGAVDITLKGRNLLQGQSFDSIAITQAAMTLTIHALKPGDSGLTVEVVAGAGALAVAVSGSDITITLAAGGSTVNAIATAINADGADTDGIVRALETASGTMTDAAAATAMTGGDGEYAENTVTVAGEACLPQNETGVAPTAKWSDTEIKVTCPALASLEAGDLSNIVIQSDGTSTQALTVDVAA
jgi:hypothetical protein